MKMQILLPEILHLHRQATNFNQNKTSPIKAPSQFDTPLKTRPAKVRARGKNNQSCQLNLSKSFREPWKSILIFIIINKKNIKQVYCFNPFFIRVYFLCLSFYICNIFLAILHNSFFTSKFDYFKFACDIKYLQNLILKNEHIKQNYLFAVEMRPYQAFFKKRLNTQSFLDTEMSTTYMSDLTSKIISSLKNANIQGSKKRQKMEMAKSRVKTKQNQQAEERQKLRNNIDSRMRISQSNLDKINSERKKALSSRSQMEETRRKKFRQNEKKQLQKSLVTMHKNQKESEKFFRETQMKKLEQYERLQKIPGNERTRYGSYNQTKYKQSLNQTDWFKNSRSNSSMNGSNKPAIKVLKITQTQIRHKQEKKNSIQVEKQCKYLSEYISKMENILNVRKKGAKQSKQPTATLPKVISKQRKVAARKSYSIGSSVQKDHNNESPSKKVSFSEMYMQKLTQKRSRKEVYHSLILQEGDEILQKQQQKRKTLKQSKIIKESLNEYKRWANMMAAYKNQ